MSARLALLAGVLLLVLATMSTIDLDTSAEERSDVQSYLPMAEAAPDRPDEEIGSAYTGRFFTHWTVGMLREATGASLETSYLIAWALVSSLLLLVLHALLRGLGLPLWTYVLCAGLFLANPYAIRQEVLETGRVQDLVCVLGVAIVLLGLVRVKPALVLLGLAVGVCGRQTALLVAPVAAGWIFWAEEWKRLPEARRAALAVACVALVAALYAAVKAITEPFTTDFEPHFPEDTLLDRLDTGSASDVAKHVLRTFIPLLVPAGVVVALLSLRGRGRVPRLALGAALVAAAIIVQPLVIDPDFPGFESNEQRLAGLGLLPVAFAIAVLARDMRPREDLSAAWWAALAVLLFAGSLHHVLTDFGPSSLGQFVALQAVVAAGLAVLVRKSLVHQAAS